MSALPPGRATQLRMALALVLLEHKPERMGLSGWLASLRQGVQFSVVPRVAPVEGQESRAQARVAQLDVPAPRRPRVLPQLRLDPPSPLPVTLGATRPSRAGPTAPTTAHDAPPAELLRVIATVLDEHDTASTDESARTIDKLTRSWAILEQVALAAWRLPVSEDEPGPSRAAEEAAAGMRTRGRARKASDKVTRGDVEQELFAAVARLVARTLDVPSFEEPAAALALVAPLLVHLSASFPHRTLFLLAPPLFAAVHALLFDLLCALAEPQLAAEARVPAILARLGPILSLAHLALPAAPTLLPAPSSSSSHEPLAQAIDALVRLVAGTGVDAQLAAVRLLCVGGPSVEAAVLGLLERAWGVRDALRAAGDEHEG